MSELLPIGIYTIPEISYVGRTPRQCAPGLVDGDRRQRLLVYVHSDHDH